MLGRDAVYDRVPYFYTDQYDLSMEYAGYAGPGGYDQVIFRGDVGKRELTPPSARKGSPESPSGPR